MKCPYCIKQCSKCGKLLVANLINFYKTPRGKYGLRGVCKKCEKTNDRKRSKQYYEENKENTLKKNKQYYEENKEDVLKRRKQYYEENKDNILERCKQYKENNPEKVFNQCSKRRLKEERQGSGITKEQWLEMMDFFDWKCAYSGITLNKDNRSIDHIIPLNNNGLNEPWNCIPMLKSYNSSKCNKDMITWYKQQEFFNIDRLMKIYEWQEYAFEKWGDKQWLKNLL